jgi:hypothetical protein
MKATTWYSSVLAFVLVGGCGGNPQEPAAPTTSSDTSQSAASVAANFGEPGRAVPRLRTGVLEPRQLEVAEASVSAYGKSNTVEVFSVTLPFTELAELIEPFVVPLPGDMHTLASFVDWGSVGGVTGHTLWVRRRLGAPTSETIEVKLLSAGYGGTSASERLVRVRIDKLPKADPKLEEQYLEALARYTQTTPLAAMLSKYRREDELPYSYADWSMAMRMATGYESVEVALYTDQKMRGAVDPAKATVPIGKLVPPTLTSHDWARMIAALPAAPAAAEALASLTPADFYFVRAKGFEELQRILDESDTWITPLLRLARGGGQRLDLVERYRAQLGLSKSELVRIFGPKLIRDLALVGSDPFVRQGSDLSLLIRSTDPKALANILSSKLSMDFPGGVRRVTFEHRGITVQHSSTPDGVLRQYLVELPGVGDTGPVTVVSNSRGAATRIIDVAVGGQPALSAQLDFRYMLLRDREVPSDVLAYAGDAFVRRAIGPEQRVLDARRQLARAELARLGYSALLFGWLEGREPKDTKELMAQPWFEKGALKHTTGETISFDIGQSPRSSYGTPAFLEPIIDLPVPTKVTPSEQEAYASLAQSYMGQWSENVDPIAVRVQIKRETGKVSLLGHVRILPALDRGDYSELRRMAGDGQVSRKPPLPGYHTTLAIGKDSELRRELSGQSRSFLGKDFTVDWLGDWIAIGAADEPSLAEAVQLAGEAPELPGENIDDFDALQHAPLYIAIDLKKPGAAAVALTVLRKLAEESVPDVQWGVHEKHGGSSIVRVHVEEVDVYYALTKQRLLVSLELGVLLSLIDVDDRAEAAPEGSNAGQLSLDIIPRSPSSMIHAGMWLIERGMRESLPRDAKLAEVLLRGTPGRSAEQQAELSSAYVGFAPVTADGQAFRLERFGITDPARGSLYRPVFGDVPAPGSPLERLFGIFLGLNVRLGFDEEPGVQNQFSLRSTWIVERRE